MQAVWGLEKSSVLMQRMQQCYISFRVQWAERRCPPKIHTLKSQYSDTGSGASGRLLDHEGGALRNGISALIKGATERSLDFFLPCKDTARS